MKYEVNTLLTFPNNWSRGLCRKNCGEIKQGYKKTAAENVVPK